MKIEDFPKDFCQHCGGTIDDGDRFYEIQESIQETYCIRVVQHNICVHSNCIQKFFKEVERRN